MHLPLSTQSGQVNLLFGFFDSACNNHMTPYPFSFTTYAPLSHSAIIHIANVSNMIVKTIGTINTHKLSVPKVFHVLELSINLFSVGQLCKLGYRLVFLLL